MNSRKHCFQEVVWSGIYGWRVENLAVVDNHGGRSSSGRAFKRVSVQELERRFLHKTALVGCLPASLSLALLSQLCRFDVTPSVTEVCP